MIPWEGKVELHGVHGPPTALETFRTTAIIATLRRSRMFADLPGTDLEAIAAGCSVRTLEKDEVLFREGDRADGFYVMQTGRISISRLTPDGREQVICVFEAPDSFAEVTLATLETYPANAVALESSQVILVHKGVFRELVCQKPELALHMLASMSLHLKHLVQTLHDLRGRQIESRLAEWLLRDDPGAAGTPPVSLVLPVSKKVLASQLGVASETLSRTFARFRQEKLIEVNGARVHLLDAAGLRRYVEPGD